MPDPANALFAGLFDDAAIFPPGNAPLPDAVCAHAEHCAAWYAPCVGTFVCSASRLDELVADLQARGSTVELSLTVPAGLGAVPDALEAVARTDRVRLRAIEVPLDDGDPRQALKAIGYGGRPFAVYLEVPVGAVDAALVESVRATGFGLKLRTGGTTAAAFPGEAELAGALEAAAGFAWPFKCTAGLHHAVRHLDPQTGFEHHGFLNVLLATHVAAGSGDAAAIAGVLAERDPGAIASRLRALTPEDVAAVRAMFTSFGTCSIAEPIADLVSMRLLPMELMGEAS